VNDDGVIYSASPGQLFDIWLRLWVAYGWRYLPGEPTE
jgi:hypothetical protein